MDWKDSGGNFENPPIGTHVARCIRIIDIGTQKNEYQGAVNFKRQVVVGWELPNELMTEGEHAGKPFLVSKFYTASLNEKSNLRADLKNWRGRDFTNEELSGFDSKNILGKPCMLSLTMNDKDKVRVTGVMALPRGTDVPPQINPSLYFSLEHGEFDPDLFETLSEGYKKMIRVSPEYAERTNPAYKQPNEINDIDDDIPF